MKENLVKITSPSGREAMVAEKSVGAYERAGWTRADDGSSEKPSVEDAGTTEEG